jgi:hypothetical protein
MKASSLVLVQHVRRLLWTEHLVVVLRLLIEYHLKSTLRVLLLEKPLVLIVVVVAIRVHLGLRLVAVVLLLGRIVRLVVLGLNRRVGRVTMLQMVRYRLVRIELLVLRLTLLVSLMPILRS